MKKSILLILLLLLSTSASAANILGIYGDNGWLYANTTGKAGTFICLEDGTNCPAALNASGTVTSITATGPYLTGGTITTTGTIAVNTSAFCLATGANCVASGSSGGNMSVLRFDADAGSTYTATNNSLIQILGSTGISTSIVGADIFIENDGVISEVDPVWTAASGSYYTSTQVNNIIGGLQNATIARTGTCAAVDNSTHITVIQNTTNGTQGCVLVAKNPGAGGSGGSGMTSFNINLSNNIGAVVQNNSQLYFLNTSGILLSYVSNNFTWGIDTTFLSSLYYPLPTNPLSYYNSSTFTNYYPLLTNPLSYLNYTDSLWTGNTTRITNLEAANVTAQARIDALNITKLQNSTHANFTRIYLDGDSIPITSNVTCKNISGATSQWLVC